MMMVMEYQIARMPTTQIIRVKPMPMEMETTMRSSAITVATYITSVIKERRAALPPVARSFGEDDWVFTPSVREALERLPAGSTLHVEPRAFHHMYMDKPDIFHRLAEEAVAGAEQ